MDIVQGLILYLLLVVSLSLHEWAHGAVAYRFGDRTPKIFGRLTINPLAHIDIVGTVIVPLAMILLMPGLVIFGWAKPVPINPNFFKNQKFGEIFTALAGPMMNFFIAIIASILGAFCIKFLNLDVGPLFGLMVWLNLMLCVFNLVPVPPLDGSHVLKILFKISDLAFYNFSRYGFFILLILINLPIFRRAMLAAMLSLFNLINCTVCGVFSLPPNSMFPM